MRKLFWILIMMACYVTDAYCQKVEMPILNDGAEKTVFDFRSKYSNDDDVHLYYKGGKLMLKISRFGEIRKETPRLMRLLPDGTVEPLPDEVRCKAYEHLGKPVYVIDQNVVKQVMKMIKSGKLQKIKPVYDNVYKDDEPKPLGGSFWEVTFMSPKNKYVHSEGRYLVNVPKEQQELDKYIKVMHDILGYLMNIDVKYNPNEEW
ncbi:MAG: hypothetical protein J6Z41_00860 [Prevotella sp.]|nr:hypothetical protein [Prevotella sp.]